MTLNFYSQIPFTANSAMQGVVSNGTVTFYPFNLPESISLVNFNIRAAMGAGGAETASIRVGLYSLNSGTLSIANSLSRSVGTAAGIDLVISMTNTSVAQEITPGTWFWGLHVLTAGVANFRFVGAVIQNNPLNAFPGGFIGGAMTVSTSDLPAAVATSELDITSGGAIEGYPDIILTV